MSDVLLFPPRNKGRIRKSRSPEAMGRCSISLLERDGDSIPSNVADVRTGKAEPHIDDGSLALRLAIAVFATLEADKKNEIRRVVRSFARHEDGRVGDESRALYRLLTGDKLPC